MDAEATRAIDRYFDHYADDHRNGTNVLIHWICVPLIVWSVIAALWVIPVPSSLFKPGLWAGMAMLAAVLWYYRHSRVLGLSMAVAMAGLGLLTALLFRELGPRTLLFVAIAVFVIAWIGQFVGHLLEGRRPSFFTDLFYLLVGPAWLMGKTLRRLGLRF
ncbi:DUF962 domain-containing protein [Pseudofulvimonas gallinarii]|jgi:uncharacterized membrane protein YGL010W|uniref:Putative membrane protein YGL010W n=1 Tax=Pseudofulvimonas gallinarii TaxID=634155 RepID=A0A4R3L6D8_9GAMM|nr:Mpo1-like protein [Pseudofulvimonas gallinarii]TCS93764.1 putative membrane protein YGL010W [Pseudofulvimonas gallinarii]THD13265.1 hypothetical protein B1808_08990 [Pseudofulvimonas gallinarii]